MSDLKELCDECGDYRCICLNTLIRERDADTTDREGGL